MSIKNLVLATAMSAAIAVPGAVFAQAAPTGPALDIASLVASCTASDCTALIAAAVARAKALGFTAAQINTALGAVSADLIAAAAVNPAIASTVSASLSGIAGASTDAAQRASLQTAANTVANGGASSIDAGTATAASGS